MLSATRFNRSLSIDSGYKGFYLTENKVIPTDLLSPVNKSSITWFMGLSVIIWKY